MEFLTGQPLSDFTASTELLPASVVIEVRNVGRLRLAPRGAFAFGLDYGTPLGDVAHVRFLVTAPDGALQRTDWMALPVHGVQSAHWSANEPSR